MPTVRSHPLARTRTRNPNVAFELAPSPHGKHRFGPVDRDCPLESGQITGDRQIEKTNG